MSSKVATAAIGLTGEFVEEAMLELKALIQRLQDVPSRAQPAVLSIS